MLLLQVDLAVRLRGEAPRAQLAGERLRLEMPSPYVVDHGGAVGLLVAAGLAVPADRARELDHHLVDHILVPHEHATSINFSAIFCKSKQKCERLVSFYLFLHCFRFPILTFFRYVTEVFALI